MEITHEVNEMKRVLEQRNIVETGMFENLSQELKESRDREETLHQRLSALEASWGEMNHQVSKWGTQRLKVTKIAVIHGGMPEPHQDSTGQLQRPPPQRG